MEVMCAFCAVAFKAIEVPPPYSLFSFPANCKLCITAPTLHGCGENTQEDARAVQPALAPAILDRAQLLTPKRKMSHCIWGSLCQSNLTPPSEYSQIISEDPLPLRRARWVTDVITSNHLLHLRKLYSQGPSSCKKDTLKM